MSSYADRGPLRILVAISSPLTGGGQLLDYERELRNILAAVRGARQGDAQVRIVHFATTAEIRRALSEQPVHVLHLSGHGGPGLLELEDDEGAARPMDAATLVAEAIPSGKMPPVIVLAACHTDAATATGDPSFAAGLIARGASVVIGTETSVTDVYATRLFARVYEALVGGGDVIGAVAEARRIIQRELRESTDTRDQALAALDEWSVISVLASSGAAPLLDPSAPPLPAGEVAGSPKVPAGLLSREVGEFVGRRRAQRRWPVELLEPGTAGLVVHGIGGVGKTTLAAELVRRVGERDPARLVVVSAGPTSPDQILTTLSQRLRFRLGTAGSEEMRKVAAFAGKRDEDWRDRLEVLREHVFPTLPVLLVLDNFEDNLSDFSLADPAGWYAVRDSSLAKLLADLAHTPGTCRLLITSRHPFVLPGGTEQVLSWRHLGALSPAETMKLAWHLPRLDRLTEPELALVCRLVGGHPRSLEYLDALLSGGRGIYPDVTARLAAVLRARLGTGSLIDWFAVHRELTPAIAEVITLAADDVLLPRLLNGLASTPGATELLLGMSVYRMPVDSAALLFQVGSSDESAARPGSAEAVPVPPRRAPDGLARLVEVCAASSLLAVDPAGIFVHRWTATELHRRWSVSRAAQLSVAHERAAEYWRWRVRVWPQDRAADLDDLLEARHHLLEAERSDEAAELAEVVFNRLYSWGAWDRAKALAQNTLSGLAPDHARRAVWLMRLGDVAAGRGEMPDAYRMYHDSLDVAERLAQLDPNNTDFQRNLSVSYDRLGDLALAAGEVGEATRRYQASLDIDERLAQLDPNNTDFQRDLAVSHERLGGLAHDAGRPDEARQRLAVAISIRTRLHHREPRESTWLRSWPQHTASTSS